MTTDRTVNILLVEDNPADVDLAREGLGKLKLINNLIVVGDGIEALDYLRQRGKYNQAVRPDIILLDLSLPKMDGRELLHEIKSDRYLKNIPVVILSMSDADRDIISTYQLGANCYVVKPIGLDDFIPIVQSLGDFWFKIVKLPDPKAWAEFKSTINPDIPASSTSLPTKDKIRVLIIDDNAADCDLQKDALMSQADPTFQIVTCERLAEARFHLSAGLFDVALLDLGLPDSQGLDTYKKLAAEFTSLPIVVVTGLEDSATALNAIRAGAEDYVYKNGLTGVLLSRVIQYAIERKWTEEERKTLLVKEKVAREEAEHALKARDEFLSIASHELKTPLTVLKLQLQIEKINLQKSLPTVEQIERVVDMALSQVDFLTNLVDDLLDVSLIRMGRLKLVLANTNISEVIKKTVDHYSPLLAAAKCQVKISLEPELTGLFDTYRMSQVIINLISNVIKYAPESLLEISTFRKDENAVIELADHGPGIPIDKQSKIFNIFERATSSTQVSGFGLGLFIVRRIVDAHGGTIRVSSVPGQGTSFRIKLPIHHITEKAISSPAHPRGPITTNTVKGKSILIVEDSDDMAMLLESFLMLKDFLVKRAANGKEALEYLKTTDTLPHVIILDIMMPIMDGFEFREQQKLDPKIANIPVIVMSADAHATENQQRMSVQHYLEKPFDMPNLLKVINQILD